VLITTFDINDFPVRAPAALVQDVEAVLNAMPLQVKLSGQEGRTERLVFDPKATNAYMKAALGGLGWTNDNPIPPELSAFGKHVDHGKAGVLVEAQFSNYPFLPNNVMRAEVFYTLRTNLPGMGRVECAIIVTKCKLFDAAQSTLHFEQAVKQLQVLHALGHVSVPMRVIGLCVRRGERVRATRSSYAQASWDRVAVNREEITVVVGDGVKDRERERIIEIP